MSTQLRDIKLTDYVLTNEDGGDSFENISSNLSEYPTSFTYDGDNIDYITYDLGGGQSIVKTFNYTDGKVTSIVLSGDTPAGINLTKTFHYTGDQLTSITYS